MSATASRVPAKAVPPPAPIEQLSGPERVAIVLQELGEGTAALVLREMDDALVTRISAAMTAMRSVPFGLRTQVMERFASEVGGQGLSGPALKFLHRTLVSAFGEAQAREILRRLARQNATRAFQLPPQCDPQTLAVQMANERPQTIALLLAHIPHEMAAEMLTFLPESLAAEALYRFSILDVVSPNAVLELQQMVDEMMQAAASGGRRVANLGGPKLAADILNQLQSDKMQQVLSGIETHDSPTAEKIRENLFTFPDLVRLPDQALRLLLREVSTDLLAPALRLADAELKERFFTNISARQREVLNEELAGAPGLRRADVLAAQGEIVAVALRLAEEGKIAVRASEELL
ncbi:MAG TPA: FliG C-terminal domain-containing protein [Acidocella sp.]|nr:FliG C-terminal domain-containing protein [Acidocella sp.]